MVAGTFPAGKRVLVLIPLHSSTQCSLFCLLECVMTIRFKKGSSSSNRFRNLCQTSLRMFLCCSVRIHLTSILLNPSFSEIIMWTLPTVMPISIAISSAVKLRSASRFLIARMLLSLTVDLGQRLGLSLSTASKVFWSNQTPRFLTRCYLQTDSICRFH